jgi:hypothetical protein
MRDSERELSMNRRFVLVVVLVLDPMAWFRGRGRARGQSGSCSQCMRRSERGLSINTLPPPLDTGQGLPFSAYFGKFESDLMSNES